MTKRQKQVHILQKPCKPLTECDSPASVLGNSRRSNGGNMKAFSEQQCTRSQSCCFVSHHQRDDGALHSNPQQVPQLLNSVP